jgi:hypothetical protein
MANSYSLQITIAGTPGKYTASIDVPSLKVKGWDDIEWNVVEPAGFPDDAIVYLRFFDKSAGAKIDGASPLMYSNAGKKKGKKKVKNNKVDYHYVDGKVELGLPKGGSYLYEIRYADKSGTDVMLLDPEIIVEGDNPPIVPPGQSSKRGRAAGARKAKKAKKASKSGKARTAAKKGAGKAKKTKSVKKARKARKAKKR